MLRRAIVADRDKILAIDSGEGAYDEADCLPAKLGRYLRDPNRVCYVGEIGDKVVNNQILLKCVFKFWDNFKNWEQNRGTRASREI